ncbi:DUF1003 domain-containing protein [Nakamurella leprariae]|uniref:DUF1003 domain-containing protein n=1 Tax=Nakamurella leprariae TaxID=2803911 RepID=A0A938YG55_9ACTN|nr:DUF1003 domain-containing protein [Nakamurella leprariae]MBM9467208.1 DUF1003 domain-containing protein [Nakamurella leprariae]
MPEGRTRRLDQPRGRGRFTLDIDPDSFGAWSERLARFLGTGTYLFWQTLVVIVWIILNMTALSLQWDPYPFILLNLAFSTQAAYAAPLILLAQNRQDDRDRIILDEDRQRAAQTKSDTEFIARELAALRVAVGEVATRDYLRGELERLRADLDALSEGVPPPKRRDKKPGKAEAKADKRPVTVDGPESPVTPT